MKTNRLIPKITIKPDKTMNKQKVKVASVACYCKLNNLVPHVQRLSSRLDKNNGKAKAE